MGLMKKDRGMLAYKNSMCIRGIAAICIMLGHYLSSFPWYVGAWFHGFLWVGIFFFYSGYGLRISVEYKENYLEKFWNHKIKNVFLPYMLAAGAATLFYSDKYKLPWYKIVIGPLIGYRYNTTLWYVVELFFLYIIFYIVYKYRPKALEIIMGICYFVFVIMGVFFDIGTWWYISTSAFLMGIMYKNYIDIFYTLLRKIKLYINLIFALLYSVIVLNQAGILKLPWKETYIITLIQMIMIPLFVLVIWNMDIRFEGVWQNILNSLGKISYEIYLWHMLILLVNQSICFGGRIIECVLSIIETVIWAMALNCMKRKFQKMGKFI